MRSLDSETVSRAVRSVVNELKEEDMSFVAREVSDALGKVSLDNYTYYILSVLKFWGDF